MPASAAASSESRDGRPAALRGSRDRDRQPAACGDDRPSVDGRSACRAAGRAVLAREGDRRGVGIAPEVDGLAGDLPARACCPDLPPRTAAAPRSTHGARGAAPERRRSRRLAPAERAARASIGSARVAAARWSTSSCVRARRSSKASLTRAILREFSGSAQRRTRVNDRRARRSRIGEAAFGMVEPSRGCSSVGRASASQAEGREFEPRRPLGSKEPRKTALTFISSVDKECHLGPVCRKVACLHRRDAVVVVVSFVSSSLSALTSPGHRGRGRDQRGRDGRARNQHRDRDARRCDGRESAGRARHRYRRRGLRSQLGLLRGSGGGLVVSLMRTEFCDSIGRERVVSRRRPVAGA